jgi:hypothetical protein
VVSSAPHVEHVFTAAAAWAIASANGTIKTSRFFKSCKAARRADRGPSPGTFANWLISLSISGLAVGVVRDPRIKMAA